MKERGMGFWRLGVLFVPQSARGQVSQVEPPRGYGGLTLKAQHLAIACMGLATDRK